MNSFMTNIKNTSSALHTAAESTGFLKILMSGKATRELYAEYLLNMYEIYKAIEFNLEKHDKNRIVKDFTTKEVYRSEAIYKDLKFLLGDKLEKMEILPSTKAYVERLNELSQWAPELLVAHAYTRYLADLFGGRMIYQTLKETYHIEDEGLNYYMYEALNEAEGMKDFIMEYHEKLNLLELEVKHNFDKKFINEVCNSYIYNIAISNELVFKNCHK